MLSLPASLLKEQVSDFAPLLLVRAAASNPVFTLTSLAAGFVNHQRSSKPMFTASKKTGSISDSKGNLLEYFDWQPKRPGLAFGPSKPQKMYINPCLSFFLTDQFDLKMTFRGTSGFHEFDVGKPSRPSYLDRIKTKTLTGHLILDLPKTTPTLKERQTLLASNPAAANMKKAQEFGWVLPRASPSGREYTQITVRDDLKPVRSRR